MNASHANVGISPESSPRSPLCRRSIFVVPGVERNTSTFNVANSLAPPWDRTHQTRVRLSFRYPIAKLKRVSGFSSPSCLVMHPTTTQPKAAQGISMAEETRVALLKMRTAARDSLALSARSSPRRKRRTNAVRTRAGVSKRCATSLSSAGRLRMGKLVILAPSTSSRPSTADSRD